MIKVAVLVAALGLPTLSSQWVAAEPLKLKTAATCTTEAGSIVILPPGVHLEQSMWDQLDRETARLQELETRLTAENKSLKESLTSGDDNIALVSGFLLGISLGYFLF